MPTVALTGARGFIGRHVAATLLGRGHRVRALARRPGSAPDCGGVTVVPGSLEDEGSLAELLRGADAVVHAAGVVNASCRSAYRPANVDGTARLARLAAERGCRRFVLVSSLAARRPSVSHYAESKAMGEEAALRLAAAGRLALTIVRPPAVYGPGDRATLPLLRGLSRGWLAAPAGSTRFSLLFVTDLARLVPALLDRSGPSGAVLEPDDGRPGGYAWRDLAAAAEAALGRRVRLVGLPKRPLAALGGLLDAVARASGRPQALSRGKVEELFHPDWVCDAGGLAAAAPGWRPEVDLCQGLRSALAWYRGEGWL